MRQHRKQNYLLGLNMNKEYEQAVEIVRREAIHHRYMVKSICAAYLGCDPDDIILRCRKKNGGSYAKENFRNVSSAGTYEKDG